MTGLLRTAILIGIALSGLAACGGGSAPAANPPQLPPPVDTNLDWDQGNWDEVIWQ